MLVESIAVNAGYNSKIVPSELPGQLPTQVSVVIIIYYIHVIIQYYFSKITNVKQERLQKRPQ